MGRDDLFTNIHKAIRAGLFDLVTTAGATDWTDPGEVQRFDAAWRRMHVLLDAHTHHEDDHILRILDAHDPDCTRPATEHHRRLDAWLAEIADWVTTIVADPDPVRGLALYRELALFCAEYLNHLHDEETTVMARVWELCTDDEIAATRAAFMAGTDPDVLDTSLRLMLPAIDRRSRAALVTALAASAPPAAVRGALAIAGDVLDPDEVGRLEALSSSVSRR